MLIDIDKTPFININLEPGVYRFGYNSREGKTFLNFIIDFYSDQDIPLSTYSYKNYVNKESLQSKIKANTKVFMLDRYDLYNQESDTEVIQRFIANGGIVLIDAKLAESMPAIQYKFCTIEAESDGVIVG